MCAVRRGETVAGHTTAQHIRAMRTGARPHADDTVLRCAAISDISAAGPEDTSTRCRKPE